MLTGGPTPMDEIHATPSTLYQLRVVSLDLSMTFDLHGLSGSPVGLTLLLMRYTSAEQSFAMRTGSVLHLVCGRDTHKGRKKTILS